MRTEAEIYMDFRNAMEQVNALRNIASRMSNLSGSELQSTLSGIRNNWSGDNADAFQQKGSIVVNRIEATAGDVRKIANAIEQIATRTRDAELKAISIART